MIFLKIDISAYLIIGPENTKNRPVEEIICAALKAGFTCVQLRSKVASAHEMIDISERCANVIHKLNKSDTVALLIDDRLDIALAARMQGIKVDGVHVGQDDIPVEVCRKYLGNDAIVGLSARRHKLIDYVKNHECSNIDYFGTGPLHPSTSKPDAGRQSDGSVITRSIEELTELAEISPIPVVVGGGVTVEDIPIISKTGVNGFFVISAIAGADDPYVAAKDLIDCWRLTHT